MHTRCRPGYQKSPGSWYRGPAQIEYQTIGTKDPEEELIKALLQLSREKPRERVLYRDNCRVDFHPIDDLKDWWNSHKRDKTVQSILNKLKDDQEVIEFLQLPKAKQEGQWKKLITPKLNSDEIKYLNSIFKIKK